MQMPITAEDIIVGVFYHIKNKNNKSKLPADREILHRAFYDMSKNYSSIMSLFSFRDRESFPESSQLDQALSNLDATGLISRQNLTPRYYLVEDSLDKSYKNYSKKIIRSAGIKESEIAKLADNITDKIYTA
jgi:hypothetical protein